ncbi:MAG TPA: penicillin-binding protein 1C [Gracilimonas sp.]|uniref:penicillin-binding protein 1C n=1 Tax=Gracilimonas sp. TaxID=1974203 RepID=UPI002D8E4F3B|nr:penicillin-binding protein 1C [Gracilimonas sp.]
MKPRKVFKGVMILICVMLLVSYWFCLPDPLFQTPYSTVLKDRTEKLMGAKIADDGQWRFPVVEEVPQKFEYSLLEFEDRHFYKHPGVDPFAIGRAIVQNYKAGEVVSGASTITMQVIRLSQRDQPRTIRQKIKEMILATRLELTSSKEEILSLYVAHAPFGGNVVGLEAAAWRYFGRSPDQLSWAESATLAVLPNSPGLIHPGRNRDALRDKRNRLLKRLLQENVIDSLSYDLALLEPIPNEPLRLPDDAPHVLAKLYTGKEKGAVFTSSISRHIQQKVNQVAERHHRQLRGNEIHNAAIVVLDVKAQKVLAYTGNTNNPNEGERNYVDVASAPRSTGSILKPFLYMLKLNEGEILPHTIVPDIPSQFSGYTPKNFTRTYDGAVPASEALARSLNVPAVYMLQEFGVPKFHYYLNKLGLNTISEAPEHYGLSLILGGAEGTLMDITAAYGSVAAMMNNYNAADPGSRTFERQNFTFAKNEKRSSDPGESFALNPGAVWNTFEAMVEVNRPEDESFWRRFEGARKVAWKTGTSFGYRDGWAVGVTPEYVVGVWVGNEDGEGRPGLTGVRVAAPILFDIFDLLPETSWFSEPVYVMKEVEICRKSGHKAGQYCEETDLVSVPLPGLKTGVCPYHRRVHVDEAQQWRVNSSCSDIYEMKAVNRFVLPPVEEWYYRKSHAGYKTLPELKPGCGDQEIASMKLVYPYRTSTIFVPTELDGSQGKTVFEVAHRGDKARIFWHLNEQYLGETSRIHQMPLSPKPGNHTLTLIDDNGEKLEYQFKVLGR